MNWLDKKIDSLIVARMLGHNAIIDIFEKRIRELENEFKQLKFLKEQIAGNEKQIEVNEKQIEDNARSCCKERDQLYGRIDVREQMLRETMFSDQKSFNLTIRELREEFKEILEYSMTGLIKNFDRKLSLLGDKKGIVTDLLKRIAFLEGQVKEDVHS